MLTIATMVVSLFFLASAVRTVPAGAGIGAVGRATLGILMNADPVMAWRVVCLLLILGGIVGHKFTAS